MITVIGSGFGLYGYLPAVSPQGVVLPLRYKEKLMQMPQAKFFTDSVHWVADEQTALEMADTAVIAVPPAHQSEILSKVLAQPNIARLILEKPLAVNPELSERILESLQESGKDFRINYTFRFTEWGAKLLQNKSKEELIIEWHFLAHHFKHDLNNWRRNHDEGGGVLRFYAIHFIALLAEMGYTEVVQSEMDKDAAQITLTLIGEGLPLCHLVVDSHDAQEKFFIKIGNTEIVSQPSVFTPIAEAVDIRVPLIAKLLDSFSDPKPHWYGAVIKLWNSIEVATLG